MGDDEIEDEEEDPALDLFTCGYCGQYFPLNHPHRQLTWHYEDRVNDGRDRKWKLGVTCGLSCASKLTTTFRLD